MLAFAWPWHDAVEEPFERLANRLGNSLCAGIGGKSGHFSADRLHFAYRPLTQSTKVIRGWRPATLRSGCIAAFHGYLDNGADLAVELGCSSRDVAQLYGLAIERWGDEADRRVIGEYCAVFVDREARRVRLSRSPLRAPPLYYFQNDQLAAAASVPRALFAIGVGSNVNFDLIADTALLNRWDPEASWFEDIRAVPIGSLVCLQRGRQRELRKYYDVRSVPEVRLGSDAEYIARATELLDEGVRACIAGFKRPGTTLSSGLDSPQVAVRTLAALPPGQNLPTFTFHPEPEAKVRVEPGKMENERPTVEAFAAMHPGLEPHFTANQGIEHDFRLTDFFHLMGAGPPALANNYVFHGIFRDAARRGCDLLLLAEWGNMTFSDRGIWAFPEYLVTGKWRQLRLALKSYFGRHSSLVWRFGALAVLPFLPDRLWRLVRRVMLPRQEYIVELVQPLTREFRNKSGADQRLKSAPFEFERYQPRNRRQAIEMNVGDQESLCEVYQGFEQMYAIPQRDPTAYRPFAEFCFGLPTEMFMRDGVPRWLAKQMAKGIMPEEQRANHLDGRWDADWHSRIGRRRTDLLEELDRLESDEQIAAMFDLPRLRATLEDWPKEPPTDRQDILPRENAVMRALVATRFINYVEGRNN